jgi:hypothetical protein
MYKPQATNVLSLESATVVVGFECEQGEEYAEYMEGLPAKNVFRAAGGSTLLSIALNPNVFRAACGSALLYIAYADVCCRVLTYADVC